MDTPRTRRVPQDSSGQGDGGSADAVRHLLETGEITDCWLVPEGSNYTFLADVVGPDGATTKAIYKPQAGERPLWDFPQGTLYVREYASYLVSQAIGWCFVPYTTIREGPHGVGALQQFIVTRPGANYYSLEERHRDQLWQMAVFDLFTSNADRKAVHCLLDQHDKLWGIDQGLTFNVEPKLRTVIWDFCGQPIPQPLLSDVEGLLDVLSRPSELTECLSTMLAKAEMDVFRQRLASVLANPVYPRLHRRWNTPWPWF